LVSFVGAVPVEDRTLPDVVVAAETAGFKVSFDVLAQPRSPELPGGGRRGQVVEEVRMAVDPPGNRIHAKVAAGLLPLPRDAPEIVWTGRGAERACDGCDEPITAAAIEYQVDVQGRRLRFHFKCAAAWHQEGDSASG
jgi:hypothetical protein